MKKCPCSYERNLSDFEVKSEQISGSVFQAISTMLSQNLVLIFFYYVLFQCVVYTQQPIKLVNNSVETIFT